MRRWIPVLAVAVAGVYAGGLTGAWNMTVTQSGTNDAVFDWVTVHTITGEGTPHDQLHDLFRHHNLSSEVDFHPHPRTPGALILQTPLLLVDIDTARPLMAAVTVVSLCVLAWTVARLTGWNPAMVGLIVALATRTDPVVMAFVHGSQGPLIAALIGVAWVRLRTGDDPLSGVLLACATVLKLFPGLLVVLLVWSRPRTVKWAVTAGVVLTAVGLLLPDVSLAGTLEAFRLVAPLNDVHPDNLELGVPLVGVVVAVAVLVWWARTRRVDAVLAAGSVAMVVLSPVVWVHYLAVLAVPAVWLTHLLTLRRTTGLTPTPADSRTLLPHPLRSPISQRSPTSRW